jgi:hypothetical protein
MKTIFYIVKTLIFVREFGAPDILLKGVFRLKPFMPHSVKAIEVLSIFFGICKVSLDIFG